MTYHNLCTNPEIQPPPGIEELLGLGLKFCIQEQRPSDTELKEGLERFERDIRIKYTMAGKSENPDYNKKIYIKSNWEPDDGNDKLEEGLQNFRRAILQCREETNNNTSTATNLATFQQHLMKSLQDNPKIIVLETDKNLGPAVMGRRDYIKCIMDEHLGDETTYMKISERHAINRLNAIRKCIMKTVNQYDREGRKPNEPGNLPENERMYFNRLFEKDPEKDFRIPQFYGNPKVHKKRKPGNLHYPLRPVVSQCGSFLAFISQYLDYKLQPFTKFLPSFIKDSADFIQLLKARSHIFKRGDKIFTADAVSMYTNIDPDEGLPTIRNYLLKFKNEVDRDLPINYIMKLLEFVMRNCVFQFGNTFWVQKIGTAMGTPVACIYAILFYGYFEKTEILRKYSSNLQIYKRAIDDICGIWRQDPNDRNAFEEFKKDLDEKCKLQWECEELSYETNFLDLTISIDKNTGEITTKTYQKPMNLHLYIPPNSAHTPGLQKSLVSGLLKTYKTQNSNEEDFIHISKLLFKRLRDRGYKQEDLEELFQDAIQKLIVNEQPKRKETPTPTIINKKSQSLKEIATRKSPKPQTKEKKERAFFHLPYHPKDISRKTIRKTYSTTCENESTDFRRLRNDKTKKNMKIEQLTIAYHRPKNLRDKLCSSKLREYGDITVESVIEERNKAKNAEAHG